MVLEVAVHIHSASQWVCELDGVGAALGNMGRPRLQKDIATARRGREKNINLRKDNVTTQTRIRMRTHMHNRAAPSVTRGASDMILFFHMFQEVFWALQ